MWRHKNWTRCIRQSPLVLDLIPPKNEYLFTKLNCPRKSTVSPRDLHNPHTNHNSLRPHPYTECQPNWWHSKVSHQHFWNCLLYWIIKLLVHHTRTHIFLTQTNKIHFILFYSPSKNYQNLAWTNKHLTSRATYLTDGNWTVVQSTVTYFHFSSV